MGQVKRARVFQNGRSQAVRIPSEYRFTTEEVYLRRDAVSGGLLLSERPIQPSLDEVFAELDAAGAADFTLERDGSASPEREWL